MMVVSVGSRSGDALVMGADMKSAEDQEKAYDWLGAVDLYRRMLESLDKQDFLARGSIKERMGYALCRAAMQATATGDFEKRMRLAAEAYGEARRFYSDSPDEAKKKPRMLRCDAMVAFVGYWFESEAAEKKKQVDLCWRLAGEAMDGFEVSGEGWEFGKTFNQLVDSAFFGFFLDWDFKSRERIITGAMGFADKAVSFLSSERDGKELGKGCAKTLVCMSVFAYNFLVPSEREKHYQRGSDLWRKARELDEEGAMLEVLHPFFGPYIVFGVEGTDQAIGNFEKALEFAKKTGDQLLIGAAYDWLTYHTAWAGSMTEDPDRQRDLSRNVTVYAKKSKEAYSHLSFLSPRCDNAWVEEASLPLSHYSIEANEIEAEKKLEMIREWGKNTRNLLAIAEKSGYPEAVGFVRAMCGAYAYAISRFEESVDEKKRLLLQALEHRNEVKKLSESIQPFMYWNLGIVHSALAGIRSELAMLEDDATVKESLLRQAMVDQQASLELMGKDLAFYKSKGEPQALSGRLADQRAAYGTIVSCLFEVTKNREDLEKAFSAFEQAAVELKKIGFAGRAAECYWRKARVYDDMGEYLKSADDFRRAAKQYQDGAAETPQLKDLYGEHSLYMQAWSEIEEARRCHARQEYDCAVEHFERVAEFHRSSKRWSFLAPNYSAWVKVEHAEDASRKEQADVAEGLFGEAARLFLEAKETIRSHLNSIENVDERQMAVELVRSTDWRHRYCLARVDVEAARILDKKGDHYASAEKYGSAADSFDRVSQALKVEEERRELTFLVCLSRAWQKMMLAEAEASPALLLDASDFFEQAKDFGSSEKTKSLVLGHSRFCRALEAGMRFVDMGDESTHSRAKRFLESAASYYVKAGFQEASEYAKATELLFDAHLHVDSAKAERDPEKKARLYMMAEKVLQTSAGSFMKAQHPEKREQVLRMLEEVREERELAVSLTQVLHAPSIISATTAVNPPVPTSEEAVGLERFSHADIQADVIPSKREVGVNEDLSVEIELVNAGRGSASLVKISEVVPEGFMLMERPEKYKVEGSHVDMKGKRLGPLKTDQVKLVLKALSQGMFQLKPRVLYLDEDGKYRTFDTEPVAITVKELGIRGWLKGPGRTK